MDEQQPWEISKSNPVPPIPGSPTGIGETAGDKAGGGAGTMGEGAVERAKAIARNVGEQARSAAGSAGSAAQDLARRAREQMTPDKMREHGARAGEYLTRNVNEYPLATLLACSAIAAAIGYGVAYLIHSPGQND